MPRNEVAGEPVKAGLSLPARLPRLRLKEYQRESVGNHQSPSVALPVMHESTNCDASTASFAEKLINIVRKAVREEVRDAIRAEADRQSFKVPSPWLSVDAACEYLKISRATLSELRAERKRAKTLEAKDAAFAPDHKRKDTAKVWFHLDDLNAWMRRQKH